MVQIRTWLIVVAVGIVAFIAGISWPAKPILEPGQALPSWNPQQMDPAVCLEPTEEERQVYSVAVTTLEVASDAVWLGIGAQKFLSHGLYRKTGNDFVPVCPPADVYPRASKAITAEIAARPGSKVYLLEYQLRLAGRLPDPSTHIVEVVGGVAFEDSPHPNQEQYLPADDLRPLARTVLASYGQKALAFRDRAFEEMSGADPMGTGAAQIAAATGHPKALSRVQSLMEEILAATPADQSFGLEQRSRLYELAYAMYFAGPAAQPYTAPLQQLMKRKVKSRAPPFGLVDLSPKQMCHVLDKIFGSEQSPARSYDFCFDKKYPYPQ